jgi:transposase
MSYGYSARLINTNKKADQKMLGVKLGRVCVKQNIPVAKVSQHFGVSRQTVYNWFCGVNAPHTTCTDTIKVFIRSFKPSK